LHKARVVLSVSMTSLIYIPASHVIESTWKKNKNKVLKSHKIVSLKYFIPQSSLEEAGRAPGRTTHKSVSPT